MIGNAHFECLLASNELLPGLSSKSCLHLPFDSLPLCRLTGALLHSWTRLMASLPPSCALASGQPS